MNRIRLSLYMFKNEDGEDFVFVAREGGSKVVRSIEDLNDLRMFGGEFLEMGEPMVLLHGKEIIIKKGQGNVTEEEFADDIGKDNPAEVAMDKNKKRNVDVQSYKTRIIDSWTAKQFLEQMRDLFVEKYNMESMEFNQYAPGVSSNSPGKLNSMVKWGLQEFLKKQGFTNQDILDYVKWMFSFKADQLSYPVMLSSILSKSMMTEWQYWKASKSGGANKKNLSRAEKARLGLKK